MTTIKPTITAINAFSDNYIWAISTKSNDNIALVDPGDADVCIDFLEKNHLQLSAILITHHHNDHVGGINKLLAFSQNKSWQVTVYGPAKENIAQIDVKLKEGDKVNLDTLDCHFTVLDLPGHTKGHIAYHNDELLFCGDTLFSGGCGRVFEGTPEQMHHSLTKLAKLPKTTLVYCAHEYTQANLTFALAVEPSNVDLQQYVEQVKIKRLNNQATIPTTIGLEQQINPFLRCQELTLKSSANKYSNNVASSASDVFTEIRAWKDNF